MLTLFVLSAVVSFKTQNTKPQLQFYDLPLCKGVIIFFNFFYLFLDFLIMNNTQYISCFQEKKKFDTFWIWKKPIKVNWCLITSISFFKYTSSIFWFTFHLNYMHMWIVKISTLVINLSLKFNYFIQNATANSYCEQTSLIPPPKYDHNKLLYLLSVLLML